MSPLSALGDGGKLIKEEFCSKNTDLEMCLLKQCPLSEVVYKTCFTNTFKNKRTKSRDFDSSLNKNLKNAYKEKIPCI